MQVATVAVVSPLTVRIKGSITNSVVHHGTAAAAAAGLAVGDRVLIATVDRQRWYVAREG